MSREFPKNNSPPNIAVPTVGRIVHVFIEGTAQPLAAIVACVVGDYVINASVANTDGSMGAFKELKHAAQPRHSSEPYWDWMDYQKGQAAKNDELVQLLKSFPGDDHDTSGGNEMGKLQAGAPSPEDGKR